MGQTPLGKMFAIAPSGSLLPVQCDAEGNLIVTLGSEQESIGVTQSGLTYVPVAASQSAKLLGATGAIGDVINSITYIPGTVAAGVITLIDGTGGGAVTIPIFVGGGTTALTNLQPVTIQLNMKSTVGGWHITTGANITAVATGSFT